MIRFRRARAVAALALVLLAGGLGVTALVAREAPSTEVTIRILYSAFEPERIVVPVGTEVRITLINEDPIEHEWIVGDAALHERHRTGTEPHHGTRSTEVSIPALSTRETTVAFDEVGTIEFICHLPRHEEYGMVGVMEVVEG